MREAKTPCSLAEAFERPVPPSEEGFLARSLQRLATHYSALVRDYGFEDAAALYYRVDMDGMPLLKPLSRARTRSNGQESRTSELEPAFEEAATLQDLWRFLQQHVPAEKSVEGNGMNDAFLLHLRGPLQSYADKGFGPIREAGPFPSRSAVLGIVAAVLGLPRNDVRLVELHDALRVHVATARAGTVRTDFHTVDAGGKNKTVTYRDYHHDAHFVALVEARSPADVGTLDEARRALRRPYYVPYLGRRACAPSLPLLPLEPAGSDVVSVLVQAVVEARAEYRRRAASDVRVYVDGRWAEEDLEQATPEVALIGHGERRDRLVESRRTYTGRPYTELRVRPPESTPTDPQQSLLRCCILAFCTCRNLTRAGATYRSTRPIRSPGRRFPM